MYMLICMYAKKTTKHQHQIPAIDAPSASYGNQKALNSTTITASTVQILPFVITTEIQPNNAKRQAEKRKPPIFTSLV